MRIAGLPRCAGLPLHLLFLLLLVLPLRASAQLPGLPVPGTRGLDERLRIRALLPADSAGEGREERLALPRIVRGTTERLAHPGGGFRAIAPELQGGWSSELPALRNGGILWDGRGWSTRVRAGARWGSERVAVVLAPELALIQNRAFQILEPSLDGRSRYSSPLWEGWSTADLPLRPGSAPLRIVDPGASSVTAFLGPVHAGLSTEARWWGPGVRSTLLLSSNAPGFVHLFLRPAAPWTTFLGSGSFTWIVGGLVESPWFDADPRNDLRSLSGLSLSWAFPARTGLEVGIGRLVMAPEGGWGHVLLSGTSAFTYWREPGPVRAFGWGDQWPPVRKERDALLVAHARWAPPGTGAAFWGEWGWTDPPRGLRDLLTTPQHSQGWLLGAEWVSAPVFRGIHVRALGEAMMLEQTRFRIDLQDWYTTSPRYVRTPLRPDRLEPIPWYTGRATEHGFTHRGRVLGAWSGPGSSSQRLEAGLLSRGWARDLPGSWSLTLSGERIRWNNDALYRQLHPTFVRHDVSVLGRLGGSLNLGSWALEGGAGLEHRMNYLFQNGLHNAGGFRTVDFHNASFDFGVRWKGGR